MVADCQGRRLLDEWLLSDDVTPPSLGFPAVLKWAVQDAAYELK